MITVSLLTLLFLLILFDRFQVQWMLKQKYMELINIEVTLYNKGTVMNYC